MVCNGICSGPLTFLWCFYNFFSPSELIQKTAMETIMCKSWPIQICNGNLYKPINPNGICPKHNM